MVLRWLQKQDDDEEDKSRAVAGREFQAAGAQLDIDSEAA